MAIDHQTGGAHYLAQLICRIESTLFSDEDRSLVRQHMLDAKDEKFIECASISYPLSSSAEVGFVEHNLLFEEFGVTTISGYNPYCDHIDSLEHSRITEATLLGNPSGGEFQFKELNDQYRLLQLILRSLIHLPPIFLIGLKNSHFLNTAKRKGGERYEIALVIFGSAKIDISKGGFK